MKQIIKKIKSMKKDYKISWLTILSAVFFAALALMIVLGVVIKWAIAVAITYAVIYFSANKLKKDRAKKKLQELIKDV